MQGDEFDEEALFKAIDASGARALLIGRRAMVALGLPVLTADYDYWLHADDIERFNGALEPHGFAPNHPPEEARKRGRYVLDDSEHLDVLIARARSGTDGVALTFDEAWSAREELDYGDGTKLHVPCLDHLIASKRWAPRDKDIADLRLLEALRARRPR